MLGVSERPFRFDFISTATYPAVRSPGTPFMQKTTPFAAQMQKTFPLLIHNAIKDNVTWAEISTNTENVKQTKHSAAQIQKTLPGWDKQKSGKCRKQYFLLHSYRKPFP